MSRHWRKSPARTGRKRNPRTYDLPPKDTALSLLPGGARSTYDKHCLQGIGQGHETKKVFQAPHHSGEDLVADPLKDKVLSPALAGGGSAAQRASKKALSIVIFASLG